MKKLPDCHGCGIDEVSKEGDNFIIKIELDTRGEDKRKTLILKLIKPKCLDNIVQLLRIIDEYAIGNLEIHEEETRNGTEKVFDLKADMLDLNLKVFCEDIEFFVEEEDK